MKTQTSQDRMGESASDALGNSPASNASSGDLPAPQLVHRGCGGAIEDDLTKLYEHEGSKIPAQRCAKCGEEILGDADVDLVEP